MYRHKIEIVEVKGADYKAVENLMDQGYSMQGFEKITGGYIFCMVSKLGYAV